MALKKEKKGALESFIVDEASKNQWQLPPYAQKAYNEALNRAMQQGRRKGSEGCMPIKGYKYTNFIYDENTYQMLMNQQAQIGRGVRATEILNDIQKQAAIAGASQQDIYRIQNSPFADYVRMLINKPSKAEQDAAYIELKKKQEWQRELNAKFPATAPKILSAKQAQARKEAFERSYYGVAEPSKPKPVTPPEPTEPPAERLFDFSQ